MTHKTRSKRSGKASGAGYRAVPWAALGLVIIGMALLATKGPGPFIGLFDRLMGQATGSFKLTVVHTNDTYGYVFPCG